MSILLLLLCLLHTLPNTLLFLLNVSFVVDIFAIIGRGLYGSVDPGRFGNLAKACFTLFQLITLDDWFYMYSDVRDRYPGKLICIMWLFSSF